MSVANIGFVAMVCGLNPYYTGSYSMRSLPLESSCLRFCLNPYYTGSYSMRSRTGCRRYYSSGLNPYYTGSYSMSRCCFSYCCKHWMS